MSDATTTTIALDPQRVAGLPPEQRRAALRQAVDEMVGVTFFGEMLKIARNSRLKGRFGHGGRGEEVFAAQLDLELAQRAGRAVSHGLTEAIYQRLVERV